MARRKKTRQTGKALPETSDATFNRPFRALVGLGVKVAEPVAPKAALPVPAPPPPPPKNDDNLFMTAMEDVEPFKNNIKVHCKKSPPPKAWKVPEMPDEDLEVLRNLSDLVSGRGEFDLTYTSEYVEGCKRGLPPVLLEKLRAGHVPFQDHLDLHGLTVVQSEAAVTNFILNSVALGRRCVLLIHGRGLGSHHGVPVLKTYLEDFLLHVHVRKYILAFTTARPVDGGLGASYILLSS